MIKGLVLSTFTGAGLLDRGFRRVGYCVVSTGDPIFGQEGLETFHAPAGAFEGVIGGPPCQAWAQSHNLAQDKVRQPNLIPLFERIVTEVQPRWFLMENVIGAPVPQVEGYHVDHHKLYAYELGLPQRRYRRFSFGSRPPIQILWPHGQKPKKGALTFLAKKDLTTRQRLLTLVGSDTKMIKQREVWPTLPAGEHGATFEVKRQRVMPTLVGTNSTQRVRCGERSWRRGGKTAFTLDEYLEGFGLDPDWDAPALLKSAKFQVLGNAVPVPVAEALARAIRMAVDGQG